jgi:hypothetical protein
MVVHQLSDKRLGRDAQLWLRAARMGFQTQLAAGAIAVLHLLDKRKTDAKHMGKGTLGAQPPLLFRQNFLTQINGIGRHRSQSRLLCLTIKCKPQ